MDPFPGAAKSPNFKPKWRKPPPTKILKSWPPVPETPHNVDYVSGSENFWSLARQHGRENPWDIIIYNFKTEDPQEVNWYLHHAIGCWKSSDGANFNFKDAETKDSLFPRLYIPPKTWKPDPSFKKGSGAGHFVDAILHTTSAILTTLARRMPTISHQNSVISSEGLNKVAELILVKEIPLVIEPALGRGNATYFFDFQVMVLGNVPNIHSVEMSGALANEATHAFTHWRSKDKPDFSVSAFNNEMVSWLADSIAAAAMSPSWVERNLHDTSRDFDIIYFPGWVWVNELHGQQRLGKADLDRDFMHPVRGTMENPIKLLDDYMRSHPGYRDKAGVTWDLDWK